MKELDTAMNAQESPLLLGSFRFFQNHHIDDVQTGFVAPFFRSIKMVSCARIP
jgi:hypothetical protein